eukprot:1161201-Pelagomonas_calceolata.AAC.23
MQERIHTGALTHTGAHTYTHTQAGKHRQAGTQARSTHRPRAHARACTHTHTHTSYHGLSCKGKGRAGPRGCMAMRECSTPRRPELDRIVSWLSIFAKEHCARCPTSPPSVMPKLDLRGGFLA